jgi:hypothetical protein
MAQLLSPARSRHTGRISQVLPTVKCSNCNNEVTLDQLGDHVCPLPPPMPFLPKPATSPRSATALLPTRLQNRVPPPLLAQSPPSNGLSLTPRRGQRGWNQPPPSPLSAVHSNSSLDTGREALAVPATPTRRDPWPHSQTPPPAAATRSPPTPVPEPDTKIGGEAGMAGVGRRGFAAAARAAMLATSALDAMTSFNAPRSREATPDLTSQRGPPPRLDVDRSLSRGRIYIYISPSR